MPFSRNSKNHVIARAQQGEIAPVYRPANQLRLMPAKTMNPAVSDQLAFLPTNYLAGNGLGDNGLTSRAQQQRLAKKIAQMRTLQQAKLEGLADAGIPSSNPAPVLTVPMRYLVPGYQNMAAGQVVASIPRNAYQRWEIVARPSGTGNSVFHAELTQTLVDGSTQMLDQSDPMNTPQQASNYIQAAEFNPNNGLMPRTNPTLQTDITHAGYANSGAAVRSSMVVPWAPHHKKGKGQGNNVAAVNNTTGWQPGQVTMPQSDGISGLRGGRGFGGLGALGDSSWSPSNQAGQMNMLPSDDSSDNNTQGWTPQFAQAQQNQIAANGGGMVPMTKHNMQQISLAKPPTGYQARGSRPAQSHTPGMNPFATTGNSPVGVPAEVLAPKAPTWQIVAYSQNNQIIYNAELVQKGAGGQRLTHKSSPDFTTQQDAQNWIAANPVPGATIASQVTSAQSPQSRQAVPWQNDPFQVNPGWSNGITDASGNPQTNLSPFEVARLSLDGLGDDTTAAAPAASTLFGFPTTTVLGVAAAAAIGWYLLKGKKGPMAGSLGASKSKSSHRSRTLPGSDKDDFLMSY